MSAPSRGGAHILQARRREKTETGRPPDALRPSSGAEFNFTGNILNRMGFLAIDLGIAMIGARRRGVAVKRGRDKGERISDEEST